MSTARTVARLFLFRPDPAMKAAARYIIAHYAEKHGIVLYAACLMSTHLQLVFLDALGVYPDFLRDVHRALANVVKAHRGWRGDIFGKHPSVVTLTTPESIIDKIAYVQANPVAAGAVKFAKDWPGLRSTPRLCGAEAHVVLRTHLYFRPNGSMPSVARLRFALPAILVDLHGEDGTREAIATATRDHERQAREKVAELGLRFLGAERCKKVSPYKRAHAYEVFGKIDPTFATKGGGKHAFPEAVRELREFRRWYRDALQAWRAGDRDVEFPPGTWAMRVRHAARCAQSSA